MIDDYVKLDTRNKCHGDFRKLYLQGYVRPSSKFWKRYFNKRVRQGRKYKRDNWFEWN